MEKRQEQEAPGDYGYDLVHEDIRGGRAPDERARRDHPGPAPRRGDNDRSEDFGYDESHDF